MPLDVVVVDGCDVVDAVVEVDTDGVDVVDGDAVEGTPEGWVDTTVTLALVIVDTVDESDTDGAVDWSVVVVAGWPVVVVGWPVGAFDWPVVAIGWPAVAIGWPVVVVDWPVVVGTVAGCTKWQSWTSSRTGNKWLQWRNLLPFQQ